jgi:hypothetical protein
MTSQTQYITVDLVVKGECETANLEAELEAKHYFVQKHDNWEGKSGWYLNISCPHECKDPGASIQACCRDIMRLSPEATRQWESASFREFFIGYSTGEEPRCYEDHIDEPTVSKVAQAGAGIGVALYPESDLEDDRVDCRDDSSAD